MKLPADESQTGKTLEVFTIKVREKGKKQFVFLMSNGSTNRLRIHAAQFYEVAKAQAVANEINTENPTWEAKVSS